MNAKVELKESILSLNENNVEKSSSSEEKVQELEKSSKELILKEFPRHLKYAFLGAKRSKPVIIAANLTKDKEQKLIEILIKYTEVIAWSIKDLKGTSPSICMHKILLEKNEKTSIEHQRRLNPVMK